MKTVCKQVYAKYPDFDLTDKKDFIKATVKAVSEFKILFHKFEIKKHKFPVFYFQLIAA